jgi:fructokinase
VARAGIPSHGLAVVGGEALIDLVVAGDGSLAVHPGGGPYNVARTIGRLGGAVAYLGCLSTDRFGRLLREGLEADGVWLGATVATDAPTTLALAEVDGEGVARYRFYADGTSAPGLTLDAARAASPASPAALYVGTLGLVVEPLATTLEALVAAAPPDTLVAVDPNCRPAIIDDGEALRARLRRVLARADVVKLSEEDLAWLAPDAVPVDAARALLGHDAAVALVTLGAAGAVVVAAGREAPVAAPAVRVADTIGAGDAFMGGFLAEWLGRGRRRADLRRLDDVVEAVAFACRVAARTCERPGADPPRRDEL